MGASKIRKATDPNYGKPMSKAPPPPPLPETPPPFKNHQKVQVSDSNSPFFGLRGHVQKISEDYKTVWISARPRFEDIILEFKTRQIASVSHIPAADWRERGEPDPHGSQYDVERHELLGGIHTDDEVAFLCGMASGRTFQDTPVFYIAKDRIRWLSRELIKAQQRIAELEAANEYAEQARNRESQEV